MRDEDSQDSLSLWTAWRGSVLLVGVIGWAVCLLRWSSGIGFTWAGLLEDGALLCFFFSGFSLLFWRQTWLSKVFLLVGLVALQLISLAFVMYYRFFHSFPSWATFQGAGQLSATLASLPALLNGWDLLWLPSLLGCLLWFARDFLQPVKSTLILSRALGAIVFACLALFTAQLLQAQAFIASQHNPFLFLAQSATADANGIQTPVTVQQLPKQVTTQTMVDYLHRLYQPAYKPAGLKDYPMYRKPVNATTPEQQFKNVVVVFLESFRAAEGGLGPQPPSLREVGSEVKKLAQTGWFFPAFYGNAHQTVRAELTMLCSVYPPMMTQSLVYLGKEKLAVRCLPEILGEAGYYTAWISSYDANYSNKKSFLIRHGMQEIVDYKYLLDWDFKNPIIGWGPSDLDLMEFAVKKLSKLPEPFFAEIMTLTNHHPFHEDYNIPQSHIQIPEDNPVYGRYLRGIHFTDYALGQFMQAAKKQPWFKNTLFVIMGDHGVWSYPHQPVLSDIHKTEIFHRTGLVIWSPELKPRVFKDVIGSQVDFAPTLLELLGIQSPNAFLGNNLLNPAIPPEQRYAITRNETTWNIRRGNQYCYSSGYTCFKDAFPYCLNGETPRETGFSCFETEADLLRVGKEGKPLRKSQENELLSFGYNLLKLNQGLLQGDRYVPASDTRSDMRLDKEALDIEPFMR